MKSRRPKVPQAERPKGARLALNPTPGLGLPVWKSQPQVLNMLKSVALALGRTGKGGRILRDILELPCNRFLFISSVVEMPPLNPTLALSA